MPTPGTREDAPAPAARRAGHERRVALLYLVAGVGWVSLSGLLAPGQWEGDRLPGTLGDLLFVGLTAVALWLGLGALLRRLEASRAAASREEERYRRLFERSPDGILIRQGDRIVLANPAAERLAGVAAGALVGRPVGDFVVAEELAEVEALAERVTRGEAPVTVTRNRMRRSDGAILTCEAETSPAEHAGAPAAMVVVRDVTEVVRLEQERERLARTLHVLAAAGQVLLQAASEVELAEGLSRAVVREGGLLAVFVGVTDRAGGAAMRLLGHAGADARWAEAVRGRMADPGGAGTVAARAIASTAPVVVDDLARLAPSESMRETIERGGRAALSLPLPGPQGLLGMMILVSIEPGFFTPAVVERLTPLASSLAVAMLALRRQALLRGFLDNVPMSMFVFDPEGRILELNAHWGRLNRTDEQALRGRLIAEAFSPEIAGPIAATNREVLETLAPLRYESRLPTAHGEVDLDVSKFPIVAGGTVLGVAGVAVDVTARREAEQALRASREAYRALSARLLSTREDEQARISRDLHDDLGQLLTGLQLELHALAQRLEAEPAGAVNGALLDRVVAAQALADETAEAVRRVASGLRPGVLDQLGLAAALTQAGRQFEAQAGLPCTVAVPEHLPAVDPAVGTAAWRIVQEALTNVARHARASAVRVAAAPRDGWLVLTVADDGAGLAAGPVGAPGLGLLGMRERAEAVGGRLEVRPGEPGGTVVEARLPLTGPA